MSSSIHVLTGMASLVEHHSNYTSLFQDFNLYTTALDAPALRNVVTTMFVVLNFSIVLVGGCFLRERNLFRLRRRYRPVAINHLTSWMTLKGALMYLWHTSRLPGGSAGFSLMMLTGAFGLVHQYFVNSFIIPKDFQSRCIFESGVVTTLYSNETVPAPVPTFSAARTVYNAQYHVYLYGGLFGIYEKVNDNYSNFRPAAEDVLGWWDCTRLPSAIIAKADWQNHTSLEEYFQKQGFLFDPTSFGLGEQKLSKDGSYEGFLAWGSDQPDDSKQQWKVRASIATKLNGSHALEDSTANVTNLECQLEFWLNSSWTPPLLPSQTSLNRWADITFGSLMKLSSNYGFYIEWMLNAMMMVGGSGNNDQLQPQVGGSRTYGCIVTGTQIKPELWAILSVMLLLFALIVLADVALRLFQRFQLEDIAGGDLAKEAPSGVEHWQLLLLQAMMNDKTIKLADMRDYEYKWDEDNRKYKIDGKTGSAARPTDSEDPAPPTYRSYSKLSKEISL